MKEKIRQELNHILCLYRGSTAEKLQIIFDMIETIYRHQSYYEIDESLVEQERQYRSGFIHGLVTAHKTPESEYAALYEKVHKWRYNLEDRRGAPGTILEDKDVFLHP